MRFFALSVLLVAGCTGSDTDTSSSTDDTGSGDGGTDVFSEIINITEAATGDYSCFAGEGNWTVHTADPSCVEKLPMSGEIEDFESGDGVDGCTIEIYDADTVTDSPDSSTVSDGEGNFTGLEAYSCQPWTYKAYTDPALDETKVTIQAHEVYSHGTELDAGLNSVSSDTYAVIPALLGISVDPGAGIVAGTAFDCGGENDENKIEGAQVIVKDANGNYPEDQEIRYFVNDFPNRDQPYTSADGLWLAVNVPPGRVTVELWAITESGGEPQIVGETELDIFEDSINISNIFTGFGDGVRMPDSCLSACDAGK